MSAGRLQPGSTFAERFRIERPLAEGGMGQLYVVTNLATDHTCALKILGAEGCFDDEIRARFLAEASRTPSDASDHIVRVLDAGVAEGRPWILMELLDGATLQEHVARQGPLSCAAMREVFEQLCHGLAAAHGLGLVHRDIKPENVFLQQAKSARGGVFVKVLDFGVAKALDPRRARGTASIAIGTQGWWAPEQVFGGTIYPATDVWGIGLLAYWCLTGRQFHDAGRPDQQMLALASARAREQGVGERVPPGFDAWFAQCVAWEPSQRFVDAGVAWRALEATLTHAALATAPTVVAPPPTAAPSSQPYAATPTAPPVVVYAPTARVPELPRPRRSRFAMVALCVAGLGAASIGGLLALRLISSGAAPTASAPPSAASERAPVAPGGAWWQRDDLRAFFGQWDQTLGAISRGEGANMGHFYAEQTRFRGSVDTMRTRAGIDAYWTLFLTGYHGTIRFDWSRAEVRDEALDASRTSHAACVLMVDAEPGVTLVRVPAVEDNPQSGIVTVDGPPCTHVEGVYLFRVRRAQGALQICHDTWSLEEAICRSCPGARECARTTPPRP